MLLLHLSTFLNRAHKSCDLSGTRVDATYEAPCLLIRRWVPIIMFTVVTLHNILTIIDDPPDALNYILYGTVHILRNQFFGIFTPSLPLRNQP